MIARAGSGWQTTLADLSLILFMVTASVLAQSPDAVARLADEAHMPAEAEPLARWEAGEGAPPIGQWLGDQAADARQQLTIVARYDDPDEAQSVTSGALALAREARGAGQSARIIIEPGAQTQLSASLGYDISAQVARPLHVNAQP